MLRILAVCAFVLAGSLRGSASESGYFPEVLSCGSWPDRLVPTADVLTQAVEPATPLFMESLQGLTASALAPKWLPDRFDDAVYLEYGEGAYRAQTAHLCLVYERPGCTVTLKGFAGRLVAIVHPVPVDVGREAQQALQALAAHSDPCEAVYPCQNDGAPAVVASLFGSIADELLSPAAHPVSAEDWNAMLKGVGAIAGGLQLYYGPAGPITDPAASAGTSGYSVGIWTDGRTGVISVGLDTHAAHRSKLYRELQPVADVSMGGLHLPYVYRIATAGEWVVMAEPTQEGQVPDGYLVASQQQASHQKLYFDLGGGLVWMGLLPNPPGPDDVEEAAWLCLARSTVGEIAASRYPYWANHHGTASAGEVLRRLEETRTRHLAALNRLEAAPCPASLRFARSALLTALRVSSAIWDVALPRWKSAIGSGPEGLLDWDELRAGVNGELASRGLPVPPEGWDWGECWDTIAGAEQALGIRTDSVPEP
ncbi:MAG: hypothetical protein ACE149_18495 [Armatimonadota bacterium]